MATDKLRSGVNHYIRTVLNRTDEVGCTEGVVDDQGDLMTVSHLSDGVDVRHVGVRVTECLGIDRLRVRLNSGFQGSQVVHVHDGVADALCS